MPNLGLSGAWGDYNNDGWPDLFVAVGGEPTLPTELKNDRLYKNMSQGDFIKIESGPVVTDGVNTQVGVWGDLNRDGLLDLLIATDQGLKQYTNVDGNTFRSEDTGFTDDIPFLLALSNFDNDGDLDLIASALGPGPFNIRLNDGQNFSEKIQHTIGGSLVLIEDFDNDEDFEIISQHFPSTDIYEYDTSTKSFTKTNIDYAAGSEGRGLLSAADFDNNGYIDLLFRDEPVLSLFFYE